MKKSFKKAISMLFAFVLVFSSISLSRVNTNEANAASVINSINYKIDMSKVKLPPIGQEALMVDRENLFNNSKSPITISNLPMDLIDTENSRVNLIMINRDLNKYTETDSPYIDWGAKSWQPGKEYGIVVLISCKKNSGCTFSESFERSSFIEEDGNHGILDWWCWENEGYQPDPEYPPLDFSRLYFVIPLGTVPGDNSSSDTSSNTPVDTIPTFSYDSSKEASNFLKAGLVNSKEELFSKALTSDEQTQVKAGTNASVWLESSDITSSVSSEDKDLVEKALPSGFKLSKYTDLNLYKKIGDADTEKVSTCPGGKVKISLDIPSEIKDKSYKIIRVHDGKTEVIDAAASGSKMTFETDMFSTYAIAYGKTAGVKTGDSTTTIFLVFLIVAVFSLGTVTVFKKKKA